MEDKLTEVEKGVKDLRERVKKLEECKEQSQLDKVEGLLRKGFDSQKWMSFGAVSLSVGLSGLGGYGAGKVEGINWGLLVASVLLIAIGLYIVLSKVSSNSVKSGAFTPDKQKK